MIEFKMNKKSDHWYELWIDRDFKITDFKFKENRYRINGIEYTHINAEFTTAFYEEYAWEALRNFRFKTK